MKFATLLPAASVLLSVSAEECKEKTNSCQERVKVTGTDMVFGLKSDVPFEVMEALAKATADCISCVDGTDVQALSTGDSSTLTYSQCRFWCWCCTQSWCQKNDGTNYCPAQCYDDFGECASEEDRRLDERLDERRLADENPPQVMNFEIDVCMDDIKPIDQSTSTYTNYEKMIEDFQEQLTTCYQDTDTLMASWSSYCADVGIDLSLMTRSYSGESRVMFGIPGLDSDGAEVTTYSSDEGHKSTTHMIFYSALGFITVSAFAIFGTALVVKKLNARKAADEEQAAKWVSEMSNTGTENPVQSEM